jgi:hypothetical protein
MDHHCHLAHAFQQLEDANVALAKLVVTDELVPARAGETPPGIPFLVVVLDAPPFPVGSEEQEVVCPLREMLSGKLARDDLRIYNRALVTITIESFVTHSSESVSNIVL